MSKVRLYQSTLGSMAKIMSTDPPPRGIPIICMLVRRGWVEVGVSIWPPGVIL